MYSNLFADYNCAYQDSDMAAGADNIHSQKSATATLGGVSQLCVCVLCPFMGFEYTAEVISCLHLVFSTIYHFYNHIFAKTYEH